MEILTWFEFARTLEKAFSVRKVVAADGSAHLERDVGNGRLEKVPIGDDGNRQVTPHIQRQILRRLWIDEADFEALT